ncbi:MAG TPA: arylesterase [Acidobacteriota bacterium]|nr:arylesterase [Acidobacteriota bacterium]
MTPRTIPISIALLGALLWSPGGLASQEATIVFLGDSLTAGFGLEPEEAFPALIQKRIDESGWPYRVVNAGSSGESSAGGLRRVDWLLRGPMRVLVLELGANDGLRGTPVESTRSNLEAIIDKARLAKPGVVIVIAGMMVPPNLGEPYASDFRQLFPAIAAANSTELIPFLLEGGGGRPEYNLADGIHPNAEGHRIVAGNVWAVLEPLLRHLGR